MQSWAEQYLNHLDENAGVEPEFFRASEPDVFPPVTVVTYRGIPNDGLITSFTVGLSAVAHPDWKFGRPELCISVESQDSAWGWAIGDIAYKLRGKCPFCYGEIINFGTPISKESEISAFFVFAPSIMDKELFKVQLPDWKVNIAQMYPIYAGEVDLIENIGLQDFFLNQGIDFYNVKREDVSKRKSLV